MLSAAVPAQQYTISTIAGGGPLPTPARGVDLEIGNVLGLAADAAGNAYFGTGNLVFKLDQQGVATRVAGNGRPGYSGDGGPATDAQLLYFSGIAIDGAGNLFIPDSNRIRRVSSGGVIATVAGDGTLGQTPAEGVPAASAPIRNPGALTVDSAGNLYFVEDSFGPAAVVRPAG